MCVPNVSGLSVTSNPLVSSIKPRARASLIAQLVKNLRATPETPVRFLGKEDPLEKGKATPLQYSGLENSMDCIVHGVTKSQTRLSDFHFTSSTDKWALLFPANIFHLLITVCMIKLDGLLISSDIFLQNALLGFSKLPRRKFHFIIIETRHLDWRNLREICQEPDMHLL